MNILVCISNVPDTTSKIEFDNLWIHGLVHLFGHDHKKEKDYLEMQKIEKKYSSFING